MNREEELKLEEWIREAGHSWILIHENEVETSTDEDQ